MVTHVNVKALFHDSYAIKASIIQCNRVVNNAILLPVVPNFHSCMKGYVSQASQILANQFTYILNTPSSV